MSSSFLLQTSILDRLSGPLCDAVTGQDGGKAMLEALERGNLFLVPLDDRRRWYRYHHLFADVLQARLLDEQPDDVPDLHRRASAWYEQNGEPSEAIRHALAAEDFERAADLVELAIPAMRRSRQEATVRGWLEALPDEVVRVRPVLSVGYAGALLAGGELEGVEARLRDAERWLDAATGTDAGSEAPSAEMVVVDDEEFRRLPGTIELYRAAQALARGDVPGTVRHARRALELSPEDDHLGAGVGSGAAGARVLGERGPRGRRTGRMPSAWRDCGGPGTSPTPSAARSRWRTSGVAQGRLGEAMRTYEQALQLASEQGGPVLRGTADMYVGMSELHRERDDLPAATQHLLREPGAGRAHRAAAEPVSLAGRDGADTGGRRRSGRRTRPAQRGGAPVCG